MKETFPGVQEMACNTFLKISQRCSKEFVVLQKRYFKLYPSESSENSSEKEPYIYELIRNISDITALLNDQ